jgi:hypothetical protein
MVIKMIKVRRMERVRHVACMEMLNPCRVLMEMPEGQTNRKT